MSSKCRVRWKKFVSAAELRRFRLDPGALIREVVIAEQRLLEERPELYALLSKMTIRELEQFAKKVD